MKISFIVVTYNHQNYILDCLNSIKYQIMKYNENNVHSVQVVVSDDCSTDNTVDLVLNWSRQFGKLFQEFRIITHERNVGTCRNYMEAIDVCTGDSIKTIGGDDMFPPTSVFEIMRELENYDLVFGVPFIYYDDNEDDSVNAVRILNKQDAINSEIEKKDFYYLIHRNCFLNAPATFVKKELVKDNRVKKYVLSYKYTEDYPQWLKISEIKKIKFKYLPKISVIYRRTNGSAYIIKNTELLNERKRSYIYAIQTGHNRVGKMIAKNTLNGIMRQSKKERKYKSIINYIYAYYWIKNKNNRKFSNNIYEDIMKYIQEIKNEQV